VTRDIINGTALQSAIAEALEGMPPALQSYHPALKTYFHRTADQHASIRKAHRRKGDPGWAQRKFDEGQTLYRFDERRREGLVEVIRDQFDDLAKLATLAQNRGRPMAREAGVFLGGLAHRRGGDLDGPSRWACVFLQYARIAALKAGRNETLREPAEILAGSLVASRCISLDEVIGTGRSLNNCLRENADLWEEFASGKIDFWSLREDAKIIAVLAVNRASKRVVEARGHLNRNIALRHIHGVALFCRKADFSISKDCNGLLAEYADYPVLGPKIVVLDDCVAEYAEWTNAVRIDFGSELVDREITDFAMDNLRVILSLTFDPATSCAAEILDSRDPRDAICTFGKKRLRKIMKIIALNEITPTLVQHRLLALAA
jgi:hypothetical protein